jgi:hypothetical protein
MLIPFRIERRTLISFILVRLLQLGDRSASEAWLQ